MKKTVVKVSATKRGKESSRAQDSTSRKQKTVGQISASLLSPSRMSTVRHSQAKVSPMKEEIRRTFRDALKINNMLGSEQRELNVSRDSTTALDFKIQKMVSPPMHQLHELQIHDQEDLITPADLSSIVNTQRQSHHQSILPFVPLVERIDIIERELKSLLTRVVALEAGNKRFKFPTISLQDPIQLSRQKTERKLSNSISQRRKEVKQTTQPKKAATVIATRTSHVESDIGQDSDIEENQRQLDSPSNVVDRLTKANALPNRDATEREARAVKQIVSQAVSPNVAQKKMMPQRGVEGGACALKQQKHQMVRQPSAAKDLVTESSEEVFQCLTQRQSFTDNATGKQSQLTKWQANDSQCDHDQDANGGQIKFPIFNQRGNNKVLQSENNTVEEPQVKAPQVSATKEINTIEVLQNNARAIALNTILSQNKSFSEFKEVSQNFMRRGSGASFGDLSIRSDVTSLNTKMMQEHRKSEHNIRRDTEPSQSTYYGVKTSLFPMKSPAQVGSVPRTGLFRIEVNQESFGCQAISKSTAELNGFRRFTGGLNGELIKEPEINFCATPSIKANGHSASSDQFRSHFKQRSAHAVDSNLDSQSQVDQCNINEDHDAQEYFARRKNNLQAQKAPQMNSDFVSPVKPTDSAGADEACADHTQSYRKNVHKSNLRSCEKAKAKCVCTPKFPIERSNLRLAKIRQSHHESRASPKSTVRVTLCGDACVNMPPGLQNRIVMNLIKQSQKSGHPSLGLSVAPNKPKGRILMNIICAKWWHQWCDYTLFQLQSGVHKHFSFAVRPNHRQSDLVVSTDSFVNRFGSEDQDPVLAEIQQKKIAKRDKSFVAQPSRNDDDLIESSLTDTICETLHNEGKKGPEVQDEAKRLAIIHASVPDTYRGKIVDIRAKDFLDGRPGPITNGALIDTNFDDHLTLKEGLMEHYDYEVILPQIWRLLVGWYGCGDWVEHITHEKRAELGILRPLALDKKTDKHYIDLYLEQNNWNEQILTERHAFDPQIAEESDNERDGSHEIVQ